MDGPMVAEISLAPISRIAVIALSATEFIKPLRPTCTAATATLEVSRSGMQSATMTASATPGIPVTKASAVGGSSETASTMTTRFP